MHCCILILIINNEYLLYRQKHTTTTETRTSTSTTASIATDTISTPSAPPVRIAVGPRHWSRLVTADNPHGFQDDTLKRLREITDPVVRVREEKKLLAKREKRLQQQL
jgi:hypothetical protein